jgi:hypothetical protein
MPLLETAKQHFDEDIARANALLAHSQTLPLGSLKGDVLRAAWMMSVGACDAFFSDAYADLISRALRAKELQPAVKIPDRLNNLRVPAICILREATGGWRWRMAARELIEDENVLSLEKIKSLFNQFFRAQNKLLTPESIESWILHPHTKSRLFGITRTSYRNLNPSQKGDAKKLAVKKIEKRFLITFQRRHDCIHNCDRPKYAVQTISESTVQKRVQDVVFLVERCHDAFISEFPVYLSNLGFSGVTRNRVCA